MKTQSKKSSADRKPTNRFKVGQKVTYKGKKFEVRRAYVYGSLPVCIIKGKTSQHMVSANSLK